MTNAIITNATTALQETIATNLRAFSLNHEIEISRRNGDHYFKCSWGQFRKKLGYITIEEVENGGSIADFIYGNIGTVIVKCDNDIYKIHAKKRECVSALAASEVAKRRNKYAAYKLGKETGSGRYFAEASMVSATKDMETVFGENVFNEYCTVQVCTLGASKENDEAYFRDQILRAVKYGLYLTKWGPMVAAGNEADLYEPLFIAEPQHIPSKYKKMCRKESSVLRYGKRLRVISASSNATNNLVIDFAEVHKRSEFERVRGYGISSDELFEQLKNEFKLNFKDVAKALSRMDMHSSCESMIKASTFEECGALIVKKDYFGDGQFVVNFGDKAPKVFQARGWNSAIKGMAINGETVFNTYMKKIESGELEVLYTLGNPDNIVAIIGEDSVKVKNCIATNTRWYVMRSVHDNSDACATKVTINKLGYICNMEWAEDYAFNYYAGKLDEKFKPQAESDYLVARLNGLDRKHTVNELDKFVEKLVEDDENGDWSFPIGGKIGKLLRSDCESKIGVEYIEIAGYKVPIIDVRFMDKGLVLVRRVPDVGAAEWIIAYNIPYTFFAEGYITSVSDEVVYFPKNCTSLCNTTGGSDFDGDSVAVYQLSSESKPQSMEIGTKTELGKAFIGNYFQVETEVIMPEMTNRTVMSVEEYIEICYFSKAKSIGSVVNAFTKGLYLDRQYYTKVWNGNERWIAPDDLYNTTVDQKWCVNQIQSIIDERGNAIIHIDEVDIEHFRFMIGKMGRFYSEVETGFGKSGIHAEQTMLGRYTAFINNAYNNGAAKHDDGFSFTRVIERLKAYKDKLVNKADNCGIWTCGFGDKAVNDNMEKLISLVDRAYKVGNIADAKRYLGNHMAITTNGERRTLKDTLTGLNRKTSYPEIVDEFLEEAGYTVTDKPVYQDNGMRVVRVNIDADARPTSVNAKVSIAYTDKNGVSHKKIECAGLNVTNTEENSVYSPMIDFSGLSVEVGEYTITSMFEGDVYHNDSKNKDMKNIVLFLQRR